MAHITSNRLIMSCAAIDYLRDLWKSKRKTWEPRPLGLGYFYFGDSEKRNVLDVARYLLKRLIYQMPLTSHALAVIDRERHEESKTGKVLDYSKAVELLINCSEQLSVFLFLDGIDHATNSDELINLLTDLLRNSSIRIFLTSQLHLSRDVKRMGRLSQLDIRATEEDLEVYINERIKRTEEWRETRLVMRDDLKQRLLKGADGRY
jgi:hypothetical protein